MKKIVGMIALSLTLGLSTGYTNNNNNNKSKGTDECKAITDITIQAEIDLDKGGDSELKGKLFNNSTGEEYEDVMIRVDFFNSVQEKIGSQTLKVTEDLEPGKTEEFKFEFTTPAEADHATWAIDCADEE